LLAHALVPVLGERLGALDGQAVEVQIVVVAVLLEQPRALARRYGAHRDEREADDVGFAAALPEEVREAQPAAAGLAREVEAAQFAGGVVRLEHDQRVALGEARPEAVDDARLERPVLLHARDPVAEARLDELGDEAPVVLLAALALPVLPLQ